MHLQEPADRSARRDAPVLPTMPSTSIDAPQDFLLQQVYPPLAFGLGKAAAVLVFLGLLTGVVVSAAATGMITADVNTLLASHLNALLGAFFILGVAWSLPLLRYGEVGKRRLAWVVVGSNYANWGVTLIKAFLGVAGITFNGQPANDAIFVVLSLTVVFPLFVAGAAWIRGFRR